MAETIDLLAALRDVPGMQIDGELKVTLDPGAIGLEVAEAYTQLLKDNLENGQAPDGRALPDTTEATEIRWGPGYRGYRSGELAASYAARATDTGAIIETPLGDRAARSFAGVDLVTDEALARPEVDEALSRALRRSLGDE